MPRRIVILVALLSILGACSTSAGSSAGGTSDSSQVPVPTGSGAPSAAGSLEGIPGFEIDKVRLMDAADLPAGIPVPVPFGGTINDKVSISEGQSLVVDYDPRFFATAAAFYKAWIAREGLKATERGSFTSDAASWDIDLGGKRVRVSASVSDDKSKSTLVVLWP